jgi:hypothetical protein
MISSANFVIPFTFSTKEREVAWGCGVGALFRGFIFKTYSDKRREKLFKQSTHTPASSGDLFNYCTYFGWSYYISLYSNIHEQYFGVRSEFQIKSSDMFANFFYLPKFSESRCWLSQAIFLNSTSIF